MIARRIVGALALLAGAIGGNPVQAQMAAPPLEVAEPGPAGRRVSGEGWVGNYHPAAARAPGILALGGSEGGLGGGSARIARALRDNGYSVLHLSYFRAPGQPEALSRIPLELFDRGLAWLAEQPEVDASRLGVVGASKGAEAALLVASANPAIKATVAGMPSSVVWPGFSWTGAPPEGSTWSRGGKDVPALAYGPYAGSIGSVYENGLKLLAANPETAIPIERATGPVLLVCGAKDTLWPACPMADQLAARAPRRVRTLRYADAGHGVFGLPPSRAPAPASLGALGGSSQGNADARTDGWPRILAFLHGTLKAKP